MSLVRWNPINDLLNIHREMDSFFSPDLFTGNGNRWLPSMDVLENQDGFEISLDLPGLGKDDVNISYQEGTLTIEGERKQENEENRPNYHRLERRYGKFFRKIALPVAVKDDAISATFSDGVLRIEIPKAEAVKPKQIEVKVNKG